jgi:two-component system, OmpR family, phosphate regulon sensor histidine kinase PhoR
MLKIHIGLRIAVCFLFVFLPLQSMDEWFYDRFFQLRGYYHESPTPFVLIRLNNASLSPPAPDIFQFPLDIHPAQKARANWYRAVDERLLERVEQDKPRLVVFTSFFDGVENPEQLVPRPSNVIYSAYLNEESKVVLPPTPLLQGDNYGFNNIFPDADNIVRKTHLVRSSDASLALIIYHQLDQGPITRDLMNPLFINYRGPDKSYPAYDSADILEGDVPSGTFAGKVVLIGREAGRHARSGSPVGNMSRLEVQANIIDTFVSHKDIRILPAWVTRVTAAVAVMLSVAIILYFPLTLAWVFLLMLSALTILGALFFFSFWHLWAGVANPILCIFATHLLMLGYKLSRQEEQQWKIQQEAEYLKEMDQFKNNFISLFSHDLKTPIAKIKAITDRLLTEHPSLPADVRDSLKALDKTNGELARFISDILKVTKMESMSIEPSHEVVDLNRLVEEAVVRLKFLADEKQISIIQDLEPLFSMEGDQHLIQEVITNLLENAIKYSPPNRRVVLRTSERDGKVRVEVIDEGPGIPVDEIPRVTGKFYRGKQASQTTKGSGLGLYLSKYFVELHQGRLEIQSATGTGTTVSFWLPITL